MLLTELRVLAVDTVRVFWRLLPQILTVYLLGFLGSELALKLAVIVAEHNTWLALVVFAFNFLSRLVAIVVILRLVGRELGIWTMIPDEEAAHDDRDQSLSQLLAVTLLPFLGLYAAFGEVNKAAAQITVQQMLRGGVFADKSILGDLNDAAVNHAGWFLAGLVAVYLLRRVIDGLHERTGIRVFGLLVTLIESFFMLVVILGGVRLWQQAKIWLADRAIAGWVDGARTAVLNALRSVSSLLPQLVLDVAGFVHDQIWPLFWEVLSQPIIWLAVAALVFGSQVLSLAELWRKGQPVAQRLPGATAFAKHRDKIALRRPGPPPAGVARVAGEVREAFLGDIDDKYLPTFHSIRLVLRAGITFLTAYVIVYSLITIGSNYQQNLVYAVLGGHEISFWYMFGPLVDLAFDLPLEPLRLCLLAVAFRRCLELFQQRGRAAAPAPAVPSTEPMARRAAPEGAGR